MRYKIRATNRFKNDIRRLKKQGKQLGKLYEVVGCLANGNLLDSKYRNHKLKGKFSDSFECHIEPDWLLIYQIFDDTLILVLNRTGSHSEIL